MPTAAHQSPAYAKSPPVWSELDPQVVELWAPGDSPGSRLLIQAGWWRRTFNRSGTTATFREWRHRQVSPVERDRLEALARVAALKADGGEQIRRSWDKLIEDV